MKTEIFLQRGLDTPVNKPPDGQITKYVGWVEPSRNPSSPQHAIDGYRGVYHRARIRATRWLNPSYGLNYNLKRVINILGVPALLFGLVPAVHATRPGLMYAMRGDFSIDFRPARLRNGLVMGQVTFVFSCSSAPACCCVLLLCLSKGISDSVSPMSSTCR